MLSFQCTDDLLEFGLFCYHKGYGDVRAAVAIFKRTAAGGNTSAQNNLGVFYELGYGVKKNVKKAIKPCHNPIQNPAVSSMNFSFPGAQDVSMMAANANRNKSFRLILFFMIEDLGC